MTKNRKRQLLENAEGIFSGDKKAKSQEEITAPPPKGKAREGSIGPTLQPPRNGGITVAQ